MAPPVELSVPTTSVSTAQGSKPFTLYYISVRQPLRSYIIPKRYTDFAQFHSALTTQSGQAPPALLPKKNWIKNTVTSPQLTEARRLQLETYLRAINDAADPRWRHTEAWRRFLNLPNTDSRTATRNATGTRHTDLEAAIVDPTVWLDVHRELKVHLSEARQALRKRDAAVSVQAQHEASAEVKRWLVRSGTVIIALEAGLKPSADESNSNKLKSSSLGEGEIRRRKDLLSAARKERDTLERLLRSHDSKSSNSDSAPESNAPAQVPQRPLLSSASNKQSSSRRVIGAPIKETEQTRQLDNQEVLQLQQEMMQAQDEDATQLTQVVERLKQMGIQINDELELQNEMLGIMDNDMDRVNDKINIAKKRIDKIN